MCKLCDGKVLARGLCSKHYNRSWKAGDRAPGANCGYIAKTKAPERPTCEHGVMLSNGPDWRCPLTSRKAEPKPKRVLVPVTDAQIDTDIERLIERFGVIDHFKKPEILADSEC